MPPNIELLSPLVEEFDGGPWWVTGLTGALGGKYRGTYCPRGPSPSAGQGTRPAGDRGTYQAQCMAG